MAELFESNWSATKEALLEGLSGNRKSSLDVVLENSKTYLSEAASAGATGAGSVATLNKVMLPLIRRVLPSVLDGDTPRVKKTLSESVTSEYTGNKAAVITAEANDKADDVVEIDMIRKLAGLSK